MTRIFLDANVIIAASASSSGASRVITRLAARHEDITLLATEYAWDEAERNLQRHKPDSLADFYKLKTHIGVIIEPSNVLVMHLASYLPRRKQLPPKDWPILAGAISAAADFLITHDAQHFGPLYGEKVYGVEIQRPSTVLARLQRPARGGF